MIWVDQFHAAVARRDHGRCIVTEIDRDAEPQDQYLLRIAHEARDCDRVMILGPGDARLAFEREYVSLYRRPDRLLDVEAAPAARTADLVDRLRLLEGGSSS